MLSLLRKDFMLKKLTPFFLFAFIISGCARNAITGRNQLNLVPEETVQQMALTQYKQFLTQNPTLPATNDNTEMVKRVGSRISAAITKYYSSKGLSSQLAGYKWEFNLVQDKQVNAWCMPGGKVVVYTGLLPVTQNETALAIVLGHEIAHAVLGHGRERMSQALVAQGVQVAGNVALSRNTQAVNIFNAVYAPGAQVGVLLPNSRKQESEADHYGLIFAAMAGYDPNEAVPFWTRMSQLGGGGSTPVLLSDHPSDAQRITDIKNTFLPEALQY